MKITKFRRILSSVLVISIMLLLTCTAYAGYEGDACYRNGVLPGVVNEWHAGVVITPDLYYDSTNRIVHAPGPGGVVGYTNLSGFVASGNSFMGSRYMSGVSSTTYSNIVVMAKRLADYNNIGYSYYQLLPHNSTGTYVYSFNITGSRCDGVPEYCYEFNGVEVTRFGAFTWDISKVSDNGAHAGTSISPRLQYSKFTASHQNP